MIAVVLRLLIVVEKILDFVAKRRADQLAIQLKEDIAKAIENAKLKKYTKGLEDFYSNKKH